MADIIVDRQRDYPMDVRHDPVAFIRCKQYRRSKLLFSLRPCSVLFNIPSEHPREQIFVLNIFSTSVVNFLDLARKWHHNPNDSIGIIFGLISSCVIHHSDLSCFRVEK